MKNNVVFVQLNPHACRTYLFHADGVKEAVLVDPVLEHVPDYVERLKQDGLRLTHVVDTHTHADHISGGPSLKDRRGCEYVMHTSAPAHCVSLFVRDRQQLELAGVRVADNDGPGFEMIEAARTQPASTEPMSAHRSRGSSDAFGSSGISSGIRE
jgi:glyoxylase-like metal-dependent hydrolase (beta-lactamase superfamily II)